MLNIVPFFRHQKMMSNFSINKFEQSSKFRLNTYSNLYNCSVSDPADRPGIWSGPVSAKEDPVCHGRSGSFPQFQRD